jgi:MOSC domain-containing protein YiiM
MSAHVVQINISPGGIPKRPILLGRAERLGFEGDAVAHPKFHGGPFQAILLISAEVIDELKSRGYPLFYGALGENITTSGLDYQTLRIGQQWKVGEAVLQLTKVRVPCQTLDVYGSTIQKQIYDSKVKAGNPDSPRWAMSGFYASVQTPGNVREGDEIIPFT